MTAKVIEQLPLIAGAPDGFTRLRALIYSLAAEGRLVPVTKPAEQTTLGRVATFEMGQAPPGSECNKDGVGTVFVKTGEFGRLYPEVREWTTKPLKFAKTGDVLICVVGATVGKLNLAIDCSIGRSVAAVRPGARLTTEYLYIALVPFTLRLREQSRGSAQGVIGKIELSAVSIRVPDLEEQHRIVAKVDELMALCDRLEARQQDADAAHARLVQALLDSLTQARDGDEFQASWQRLAELFGLVFSTDASVDALKEAIRQAGCSGRIQTTALAVRESSAKNLVRSDSRSSGPFNLPTTWQWIRLGSLCTLVTSGSRGWKDYYADAGSTFIRSQDIKFDRLEFDQRAFVALPANAEGTRTQVARDDLLITITGANVGKAALMSEHIDDAYVSQHVALVRLSDPAHAPFIHLWLTNGLGGRQMLLASSYGAKPGLNLQNIKDLLVPLPPATEQTHIVVKVTELLALCDQLKARLAAARAKHAQLAESLVEQAQAA